MDCKLLQKSVRCEDTQWLHADKNLAMKRRLSTKIFSNLKTRNCRGGTLYVFIWPYYTRRCCASLLQIIIASLFVIKELNPNPTVDSVECRRPSIHAIRNLSHAR